VIRLEEDRFELGAQKGRKTTSARKTTSLSYGKRGFDDRTSARSLRDW
jgi:hypothetical protein